MTSLQSPMDGNAKKETEVPFKVFWHRERASENYTLKLDRPHRPGQTASSQRNNYLRVSRLSMKSDNKHAFHIMRNLNHRNIAAMIAAGKSKLQDESEISAFIPECRGKVISSFYPLLKDFYGIIPSETFKHVIRCTFDGADFLWRNRTFHGKLGWDAILFEPRGYNVKLCDFEDRGLSLDTAQWGDYDNIISMLQYVETKFADWKGTRQEALYSDELTALIKMMTDLPRSDILSVREDVSEAVFFWTPKKRTQFVMITIQKELRNDNFIEAVRDSDICSSNWDLDEERVGSLLNSAFKVVLKHCNDYRDGLGIENVKNFNPTEKMDCVKLIYAAYTHRNTIKVDYSIDHIFRVKFPRLFVELNRIIKSLETMRKLSGTSSSGQGDKLWDSAVSGKALAVSSAVTAPGLSPSSSMGSLSSVQSSLNPNAQAFKLNPYAMSFTPISLRTSHSPVSGATYPNSLQANPGPGLPVGTMVGADHVPVDDGADAAGPSDTMKD